MAGKTILISGANRGIGRELADQLAQNGHRVLLAARSADSAASVASELSSTRPEFAVIPIELDVTDPDNVSRAVSAVEARCDHLDVLVNNAAIHFDAWQRAVDADLDVVAEALQTNVMGTWRLTQAMLPLLRSSVRARIINVSSEQASLSQMGGGVPAYKTSKVAVNALTRILAAELAAEGISVLSVSPGWTATDMGGPGGRPVSDGAASIRLAIEDLGPEPTGSFYQDGQPLAW